MGWERFMTQILWGGERLWHKGNRAVRLREREREGDSKEESAKCPCPRVRTSV